GEIAGYTLRHEFRSIDPKEARISILDGAPRLLTAYPEDLSRQARQLLVKLGVRVLTSVKVVLVDADGLTFLHSTGERERLEAKTVLWAGGVHAGEFGCVLASRTGAETDRQGRLKVNPDLTIPGYPEIFVVGDLAAVPAGDGKALPGVAQVAMQGGAYAAR